ncbi:hypothetical protein RVR_6336 [Actinacidiphila reveromycinica]|uniref:Uncharacterized protein n=1 Tax=Actinacidiphila reveromycinica TaxID=659352 RepID=A0A7U3UW03_9ACTN|nr:DUF5682 family protein [Streptomyces sp. SN-593]BBA99631.1 hypothetical protein RVR_6336 [Streptomyces sp. SN-593]
MTAPDGGAVGVRSASTAPASTPSASPPAVVPAPRRGRSARAADDVVLLGVRHHGPGSARAVRAALDAYRPEAVLIEGPAEADALTALAADPAMRPPVALLAHVADDPARAAFWPFAEFSPEWVAMRWAAEAGAVVRFIDLPAAHTLAMREAEPAPGAPAEPDPADPGPAPGSDSGGPGAGSDGGSTAGPGAGPHPASLRVDPLAVLAETAGYDDPERWWEDAVEHRGSGQESGEAGDGADPLAPFAAIAEAMTAIRTAYGDGGDDRDPLREAHMRLRLREARRAYARTAVVCGAWHVPALGPATATADRNLLKGLPKAKVETTWVPWTHRRLARAGGYGAGIDSPGWYQHLFTAPDRPVTRWMTKVAGLLREEDLPVSSADVIESVRLADTLAAMRGRPLAGLGETVDAVRAVMCDGSEVPLALIRDRLVVGDALGEVPPDAPAVPLARDLAREQRRLRLKPEALERELDLDLRKETDAGRSRLLHRLRLLGVDWGEPGAARGGKGTFRETWKLRWEPESAIRVAEAGIWGTTVEAAAGTRAQEAAIAAATLADVTSVAERCLLAGLSDALPAVMRVLADRAALDADVAHLAAALPALVRAVRYGDVRGTDSAALARVAAGLAERVRIGFPPACANLDRDGAAALRTHLDEVHRAIALLPDPDPEPDPAPADAPETAPERGSAPAPAGTPEPGSASSPSPGAASGSAPGAAAGLRDRWAGMLRSLAERDDSVPGLLRGAAARLLLDEGRLDAAEAARLMGLALSPGTGPAEAAGWVEGFLAGGGMLLLHDERLLGLVDGWLAGVPQEAFTDVLPLLRRTFAEFEPGVRRSVGELVRRGPAAASGPRAVAGGTGKAGLPGFGPELDRIRANKAARTVRLLLGRAGTTGPAELDDEEPAEPDTREGAHA